MNNQFLMNKPVNVGYAFKKDGKGERHGTPAERLLAAQARKNNALPPTGLGTGAQMPPPPPGMGGYPQRMPMGGQGMGMPGMPMLTGSNAAMMQAPPPPPPGFGQQFGAPPMMMQQQQQQYGFPPPPPVGFQ